MATSVVSPAENQSILALAPTMKDIPSETIITQLDAQADEPTQFDPLATNTSVPSSDDDDDRVESADDSTDAVVGDTNTIVTQENSNAIFTTTAAAATDSTIATTTTTVVAASEEVEEVKDNDTVSKEDKVKAAAESSDSITVPEPKDENTTLSAVPPQPQEVAKEAEEIKKEVLKINDEEVEKLVKAIAEVKTFEQGEDEPRKSLSRPLSRQDLRRKSSFFNSKDIVVSDRRYSNYSSTSTSSSYSNTNGVSTSIAPSMRPIADPRFKNRFQNILAQWKARADN
ncbi:hypothetical protein BGX26_006850 [Mortierella sp. AD094]|nr:hypothetical protein BGX26_006850 [Mortierella sp. AD094]